MEMAEKVEARDVVKFFRKLELDQTGQMLFVGGGGSGKTLRTALTGEKYVAVATHFMEIGKAMENAEKKMRMLMHDFGGHEGLWAGQRIFLGETRKER